MGTAQASLVRFTALCAVIAAGLWNVVPMLEERLLPLVKAEVQWLDGTFRVDRLYLTREAGEPIVRLEVGLARPLTVDGRTYLPDPRGKAVSSTLMGHAVLPLALFLASLFAIPAAHPRGWLLRLAVVVPGALLIEAIGMPIVLLAGIWRWILAVTHSADYPALLVWDDFVQQGGANVLAICSGVALGYVSRAAQPTAGRRECFNNTADRMALSSPPAHSGNGTSAPALPSVPSVADSSQSLNRGSQATIPPPIVPNS